MQKAKGKRIAIIGDFMIDRYFIGTASRLSPEAPVPVLLRDKVYDRPGGAGNVLYNILTLGVEAELFCDSQIYVGDSIAGNTHANPYPCAVKERLMSGNHQLLRIDTEVPSESIEWRQFQHFTWWRDLMERFEGFDAIVMSDYGKGVLSDNVINTVLDLARIANKPVVVDAKGNFQRYSGATVMKCNQKEARDGNLLHLGKNFDYRVVTQGESGISYFDKNNHQEGFAGIPENVIMDVTGAGDTVTAILGIIMALGLPLDVAIEYGCELANVAAAYACTKPMVYAVTMNDLKLKAPRLFGETND